jgi:hypothetical protein
MDISAGLMNISAGSTDISAGSTDISAGSTDISAGLMDISAGLTDISAGLMDISAGSVSSVLNLYRTQEAFAAASSSATSRAPFPLKQDQPHCRALWIHGRPYSPDKARASCAK